MARDRGGVCRQEQERKWLKIRLQGSLAQLRERAVAFEGVTAAEIARRAILVYLQGIPQVASGVESRKSPSAGTAGGQIGVDFGVDFGTSELPPPSSPPPSSPPAPPLTPPSLSPPAGAAGGAASPVPPPPPSSPTLPPPLLLFPCVAGRRGEGTETQWPLTAALVAQWEESFPEMDVLGEARKARAWLLANHRKTYGGMKSFLVRWLLKAQDSGRFLRRAAGASPRAATAGGAGRSLEEVYGFASWEAWAETLRQCFTGAELDEALAQLAAKRARWEERREGKIR